MSDGKAVYRFEGAEPLGRGGHAEVWPAVHRHTGEQVAFKRALLDSNARARLKREIDAQQILVHKHIMPVLDSDPDYEWFTMPRAIGNLQDLRPRLDETNLLPISRSILRALGFAHELGYRHRDVTPGNVLALPVQRGRRWVLGDWGLVARPRGLTTGSNLTRTRTAWGTDGFAAPETWDDAHEVTGAADIYSFGQIIGWFLCGSWPQPNVPLLPEGKWRAIVRAATVRRANDRPTAEEMLDLVAGLNEDDDLLGRDDVANLVGKYRSGAGPRHLDPQDATILSRILDDIVNDEEAMIDDLPTLPRSVIVDLAKQVPDAAAKAAIGMCEHLIRLAEGSWGGRQFSHAETVLSFVEAVAAQLAHDHRFGLLEDVAEPMLAAEVRWQRFSTRRAMRTWVTSLRGDAATTLARALRRVPEAARWHLEEEWSPHAAADSVRAAYRAAKS